VAVLSIDFGFQSFAERFNTLRERISVLAFLNRIDASQFYFSGNVEIRLADREIDRILELRSQIKNFANAATVK
jgi:hypothetical protein